MIDDLFGLNDSNSYREVKFRDFSAKNKQCFVQAVSEVDWTLIFDNNCNVNFNTDKFLDKLYSLYNNYFPKCSKRISYKRIRNPWVTKALLKSIDEGHRLYKLMKNNLVSSDFYKSYKNKLTGLIRKSKKMFFGEKFGNCCGNIKSTWKKINNLIGRNKKSDSNFFNVGDAVISDPNKIASEFNDYFLDSIKNISNNIEDTNVSYMEYMPPSNDKTAFFIPSSVSEVSQLISSFKNKTSDIDSIPTKVFKLIANYISLPISCLFNQSLEEGSFPVCLKRARVVPIIKKGDPHILANYRPISTLPFLAKVFEKLMASRANKFLLKNNILNMCQFGFKSDFGTNDALISFMNYVYDKLINLDHIFILFLDYSRAFDTINHDILLNKLYHYGFRGNSYKWFCSYLSDRYQLVDYYGHRSCETLIDTGVPQGSVLGPLLFTIYVNDFFKCSQVFKSILYADDTTLLYSHKDFKLLIEHVNNELVNISNWTKSNKLSINLNKTKYMIISNKYFDTNDCQVVLDDEVIERVRNFKFLGVIVDENLNFKDHISLVCLKISRSAGLLRNINYLPINILLIIYFSIVYPHYMYGLLIWGSCAPTSLLPLIRNDKKVVRAITGSDWLAHTSKLFKSNDILKFSDLYNFTLGVFMFNVYNSVKANFNLYREIFNDFSFTHDYDTRGSNRFKLPFYRLGQCQRFVFYQGAKLWNILPDDFKCQKTVNAFKKNFKKYFINKY